MTLSKSQPWATLYQPMKRMPYFASYSFTWRGKIVRMKNLKNASRPRRTEKYVARTGTDRKDLLVTGLVYGRRSTAVGCVIVARRPVRADDVGGWATASPRRA